MRTAAPRSGIGVLVVTENPSVVLEASRSLPSPQFDVIGCLGPAHSKCKLEDGACSLMGESNIAIIDSPASGAFIRNWKIVPSGDYAERLARAHPDGLVLLCGAPDGSSGPSGEVVHMSSTRLALALLGELNIRSGLLRSDSRQGG